MSDIDTNGVKGFMRRVRRGTGGDALDRIRKEYEATVDQRAAAIDQGMAQVIHDAGFGRVPAPQDPDLYGGRRTVDEPGQRIAARESGLADEARRLDDDYAAITNEMETRAQLIEENQKWNAELEKERARIAAVRDGVRKLLGGEISEGAP